MKNIEQLTVTDLQNLNFEELPAGDLVAIINHVEDRIKTLETNLTLYAPGNAYSTEVIDGKTVTEYNTADKNNDKKLAQTIHLLATYKDIKYSLTSALRTFYEDQQMQFFNI